MVATLGQKNLFYFFSAGPRKFWAPFRDLATVTGVPLFPEFGPAPCKTLTQGFTEAFRKGHWCTPLAAGSTLGYVNPFDNREGLGQRLELLSVYAETEAGTTALGHLGLALLSALLFQSYALLLTATRPVTAIFAFLGYLLLLLLPFFGLDGDYLGVIHLLVYPGAILIFFAFASLTTDQRGS